MNSLSGRLKQVRRKITYSDAFTGFLASLAVLVIRMYVRTLKVRLYRHPEYLRLDSRKLFYGLWHGRQFLLVPYFGRWNIALMANISWAGEIQAKILQRFGYRVVRGSSSRGGVQALLNMKDAALEGYAGAFAMDGPHGPVYKSKPGMVFLARKLNRPVVPLTTSSDRFWILKKTWCRYRLPKPFSRCWIAAGRPLWPSESDIERTDDLDRVLVDWMNAVDGWFGLSPERFLETASHSIDVQDA